MDSRLTTQEFWTGPRENFFFKRQDPGHSNDDLILKYIPKTEKGNCIEIGSYPGPHLATLGDLGYELNGIDFTPDNAVGLPAWLRSEGFKVDGFVASDFFDFDPGKKFDVVCSFGFIEHFTNYQEVIQRHAGMVKDQGYLLITTPNFRGAIQYWLHKNFDKENLAMHNTDSMRPAVWADLLKKNGFEILYQGYFGGFWFWKGEPGLTPFKRKMIWLIERIIPRMRKVLWFQSASFSAQCGIVAKRIQ